MLLLISFIPWGLLLPAWPVWSIGGCLLLLSLFCLSVEIEIIGDDGEGEPIPGSALVVAGNDPAFDDQRSA
jgi:hypothetical protein